jgi:hypothetical protein
VIAILFISPCSSEKSNAWSGKSSAKNPNRHQEIEPSLTHRNKNPVRKFIRHPKRDECIDEESAKTFREETAG